VTAAHGCFFAGDELGAARRRGMLTAAEKAAMSLGGLIAVREEVLQLLWNPVPIVDEEPEHIL